MLKCKILVGIPGTSPNPSAPVLNFRFAMMRKLVIQPVQKMYAQKNPSCNVDERPAKWRVTMSCEL